MRFSLQNRVRQNSEAISGWRSRSEFRQARFGAGESALKNFKRDCALANGLRKAAEGIGRRSNALRGKFGDFSTGKGHPRAFRGPPMPREDGDRRPGLFPERQGRPAVCQELFSACVPSGNEIGFRRIYAEIAWYPSALLAARTAHSLARRLPARKVETMFKLERSLWIVALVLALAAPISRADEPSPAPGFFDQLVAQVLEVILGPEEPVAPLTSPGPGDQMELGEYIPVGG